MKNRLFYATLIAACISAACAKPFSPPGGQQDRSPPRLVSVTPAALAVVPDFNGNVVFTFNETLAERGINDAAVSVSPQPRGKVHVKRKGDRIEVSVDGGWARNQVYRVSIQKGVGDRFNNARKDPVEIVFSTGPPIQPTAIAGIVTDRLTRRASASAVVQATRRLDSAAYLIGGDTAGFFALRNIPAGVYDVLAFIDGNNNHRRDPQEPGSPSQQIALGATDTIATELVMLPADTTGPDLRRADATDSTHVTLNFDDAIDENVGLSTTAVSFIREADSVRYTGTMVMRLKNVQQRLDANRRAAEPGSRSDSAGNRVPVTRADSLRADSLRADSLRADSMRLNAPPAGGRAPVGRNRAAGAARNNSASQNRAPADTMPLPDRDVIVTLDAPLAAGKYRVSVTGIRNVNGLLGGGTAELDVKAPPAKPAGGKDDPAKPERRAH
jgi:hypothetical protein